jgi:hypothetical protein
MSSQGFETSYSAGQVADLSSMIFPSGANV